MRGPQEGYRRGLQKTGANRRHGEKKYGEDRERGPVQPALEATRRRQAAARPVMGAAREGNPAAPWPSTRRGRRPGSRARRHRSATPEPAAIATRPATLERRCRPIREAARASTRLARLLTPMRNTTAAATPKRICIGTRRAPLTATSSGVSVIVIGAPPKRARTSAATALACSTASARRLSSASRAIAIACPPL